MELHNIKNQAGTNSFSISTRKWTKQNQKTTLLIITKSKGNNEKIKNAIAKFNWMLSECGSVELSHRLARYYCL